MSTPSAPDPAFKVAENLCEVLANDRVNADYRLMVLRAGAIAVRAAAGQFFHLACPPVGDEQALLRRPMSVYRVDVARDELQFLYKVQGAGTRGLASLQPGQKLNAFGPLGRGFVVAPGTREVLLLGRGVGLATMAPLAELARREGARVTAVLSARRADLVMSVDYLRAAGADVVTVTDAAGDSGVADVEALLRNLQAARGFDLVATCGSNRLLLLLQGLAREWGVAGQVALEQHMGCAIGMCYACVRPFRRASDDTTLTYRRVCWEGPVFDLQEALTW